MTLCRRDLANLPVSDMRGMTDSVIDSLSKHCYNQDLHVCKCAQYLLELCGRCSRLQHVHCRISDRMLGLLEALVESKTAEWPRVMWAVLHVKSITRALSETGRVRKL